MSNKRDAVFATRLRLSAAYPFERRPGPGGSANDLGRVASVERQGWVG